MNFSVAVCRRSVRARFAFNSVLFHFLARLFAASPLARPTNGRRQTNDGGQFFAIGQNSISDVRARFFSLSIASTAHTYKHWQHSRFASFQVFSGSRRRQLAICVYAHSFPWRCRRRHSSRFGVWLYEIVRTQKQVKEKTNGIEAIGFARWINIHRTKTISFERCKEFTSNSIFEFHPKQKESSFSICWISILILLPKCAFNSIIFIRFPPRNAKRQWTTMCCVCCWCCRREDVSFRHLVLAIVALCAQMCMQLFSFPRAHQQITESHSHWNSALSSLWVRRRQYTRRIWFTSMKFNRLSLSTQSINAGCVLHIRALVRSTVSFCFYFLLYSAHARYVNSVFLYRRTTVVAESEQWNENKTKRDTQHWRREAAVRALNLPLKINLYSPIEFE